MIKPNPNPVYIDPLTDYGFKRLFGEERNKALLMDFLNASLPLDQGIKDLSFINVELQGRTKWERKAVVDVLCELKDGHQVLVELQRKGQSHFLSRSLFYSSQVLQAQSKKGRWDYKLRGLYCICLLDFELDIPNLEALEVLELRNEKGNFVNPYLWFMYIQLPLFKLGVTELDTRLNKWIYMLKNVNDFETAPDLFTKDSLFFHFLEEAELAKLSPKERRVYEQKLKIHRDLYNVLDFAEAKALKRGLEQGLEQGLELMLKKMVVKSFKQGQDIKSIADFYEISEEGVKIILREEKLL